MYLAWQTREQLGRPFRFAELADEINMGRPSYVVDRVVQLLNERGLPIKGTEVLVLGVAYKPNVGDLRESPAVEVVKSLTRRTAPSSRWPTRTSGLDADADDRPGRPVR